MGEVIGKLLAFLLLVLGFLACVLLLGQAEEAPSVGILAQPTNESLTGMEIETNTPEATATPEATVTNMPTPAPMPTSTPEEPTLTAKTANTTDPPGSTVAPEDRGSMLIILGIGLVGTVLVVLSAWKGGDWETP